MEKDSASGTSSDLVHAGAHTRKWDSKDTLCHCVVRPSRCEGRAVRETGRSARQHRCMDRMCRKPATEGSLRCDHDGAWGTERFPGKVHANPPGRLEGNACAMPDRRRVYESSKTLEIVSAFDPFSAVDSTPDPGTLPHHVKLVRRRNTSAWCSLFATPAVIGFQMC